ncbi:hypothetical protein Fmac_002564 [Flemingia macrophylla]|uniref:Uncharacterized protein n=1 Tax=Flemingia macrophylla TaxID=520843 RepID=A0ABD1NKB2_9FABA
MRETWTHTLETLNFVTEPKDIKKKSRKKKEVAQNIPNQPTQVMMGPPPLLRHRAETTIPLCCTLGSYTSGLTLYGTAIYAAAETVRKCHPPIILQQALVFIRFGCFGPAFTNNTDF